MPIEHPAVSISAIWATVHGSGIETLMGVSRCLGEVMHGTAFA